MKMLPMQAGSRVLTYEFGNVPENGRRELRVAHLQLAKRQERLLLRQPSSSTHCCPSGLVAGFLTKAPQLQLSGRASA